MASGTAVATFPAPERARARQAVRVFALDFDVVNGVAFPKDARLHQLAIRFAEHELAETINFADYRKLWVACEVGEDGSPMKAVGLLASWFKLDFPVARFTSPAVAQAMLDRANDYLQDEGLRGAEVFIYIPSNDPPEARCPNRELLLQHYGARPADRVVARVK